MRKENGNTFDPNVHMFPDMNAGQLIAFWGVSFLLVLVPGADWAYVIGAGLRGRSVLASAAGLLVGYVALTVVVAAGVGAVVATVPHFLSTLTIVGAAYLIFLGLGPLAKPTIPIAEARQPRSALLAGIGTSGLNPKGLLLFLALLPQFTDPRGRWPTAVQIAALGLVHVLSCGIVYPSVGLLARAVLGRRPRAARAAIRTSGAAMIIIGLALLIR
jgi:threonine/homoserine/homoserine lactone efflux protein